ncbi:hypothetical protein [Nocardia cyriacigeorgica]|uniref:hypothetical protein n=1 Tax=Nocardia cyriacigeorgica TaxID=135487 RepID=UPI001895E685|nr:hypothetical protein [Nocardia cyriacigeorgica]MBF6439549.1 hypothetical protein [Nocardia cyriacigeorgica]
MSAPTLAPETTSDNVDSPVFSTHDVFALAIGRVRDLFAAGDSAAARREFEDIISGLADPDEKQFLVNLTATFMRWPYPIALARLRALWKAHPAYRELLDACVPDTDPGLYQPPTRQTSHRTVALGDDVSGGRPHRVPLPEQTVLKRTPSAETDQRKLRSYLPERMSQLLAKRRPVPADEPTVVATYAPSTYGVDQTPAASVARYAATIDRDPDDPATLDGEILDGYAIDYDQAALHPVVGWRCVHCFIERAVADTRPIDPATGQRRSDDGLCDHCREDGHHGLPALPAGYARAQQIETFCEALTDRYPTVARALLRDQFRRSPFRVRTAITNWVHTQRPFPIPDQPTTTASEIASETVAVLRPRRDRCQGCHESHYVIGGLCRQCRKLLAPAA